ncbi:MAG TPA: GFA family protein [Caulobacter sp.]|nr:GFA family protein [Caulobacter sp.]
MNSSTLPWTGGCRCGQIRFTISAPPMLTMACHCKGCQRMTAGPYSLSLAVPSAGFEVTEGQPVIGGLHGATSHFHCPHCMSWLFTRPEGMDWFVNVRAPMLDDARGFTPFIETCTAEGFPWAKTPAPHSFEGFPEMADYQRLSEAYARQAG